MFGGNKEYRDHDELRHLSGVFDLLPLLPRAAIEWLLDKRRYRHLRGAGLMRQLGTLALAIRGEPATREHVRHILATTIDATRGALRRKAATLRRSKRKSPVRRNLVVSAESNR